MHKKWAGVKTQVTLVRAKWWLRASPNQQDKWNAHEQPWWALLRREKPRSTDWVLGGLMQDMNESYPVWHITLMMVKGVMCHNTHTVRWALLHIGLWSWKPVRVPMLNPIHKQNCLQRARECQNWTEFCVASIYDWIDHKHLWDVLGNKTNLWLLSPSIRQGSMYCVSLLGPFLVGTSTHMTMSTMSTTKALPLWTCSDTAFWP